MVAGEQSHRSRTSPALWSTTTCRLRARRREMSLLSIKQTLSLADRSSQAPCSTRWASLAPIQRMLAIRNSALRLFLRTGIATLRRPTTCSLLPCISVSRHSMRLQDHAYPTKRKRNKIKIEALSWPRISSSSRKASKTTKACSNCQTLSLLSSR